MTGYLITAPTLVTKLQLGHALVSEALLPPPASASCASRTPRRRSRERHDQAGTMERQNNGWTQTNEFCTLIWKSMDKPVQKIGGWLLAAALIALAVWNQNRTATEEAAKVVATSTTRAAESVASNATDSPTGDGSARKNWRPINDGHNTGPVISLRTPVPQPMSAKTSTPVQLARAVTPTPATPSLQPTPKKAPFVPIGAKTNLDEGALQTSKGLEMHHKK